MAGKQLYLHTSNRVESLAEGLVEVARLCPLSSPLSQETVVTLNPGIARWLQFEIARLCGVAFGWQCLLPGKLFAQVLEGFEPEFAARGAFSEDQARWHLLEILQTLEDQKRFELVTRYCEGSGGGQRYALANRLTRLYDEYLVYRPDRLLDWEEDPLDSQFDWQAEIWRRLVKRLYPQQRSPLHIARVWSRLMSRTGSSPAVNSSCWPERLFVFGISSLAPLYLDLLDRLAEHRPVHVFLLQPSPLYWADLRTSKEIQRIAQKVARQAGNRVTRPEDWLFSMGNPLLPSFGKQSQMFLDLLIDKDPRQDDSAFVAPEPEASQLSRLQADLYEIETSDIAQGSPAYPAYDGTIQVHSCSSRRREVETVWDLIVERMDADPSLRPNQVMVMAPDIQAYRSHIHAVFEAKRGSDLELPFSIADSSFSSRPGVQSGLLALLKSATLRATAGEVLELLETPLLRELFSFSENDLDGIEYWIRELGIVWGWDNRHRQSHQSFATDRNTWKELSERLLSGALFAEDTEMPSGFLSYSEINGGLSEIAGRLLECLELLSRIYELSQQTHSVESWRDTALGLLRETRCPREDWQQDYLATAELIIEALPALPGVFASGSEVFRTLAEKLERSASGGGYLSGGITFCSLKPMRAIPADTVVIMGMNRLDFPRGSRRPRFDLMAQERRIGDRNTRDEDRQLFLETILSARSHLYLTYQGIAASSDTPKEPSVVVEELLGYLGNAMAESDFQQIHHRQKRQSFDDAYFGQGPLFTYDPKRTSLNKRFKGAAPTVANASKHEQETPAPSLDSDLDLEELVAFFANPSKHYALNHANVRIALQDDALPESDPISLDALERWKLRDYFASCLRLGRTPPVEARRSLAQQKQLPLGKLEVPAFQEEFENAQRLAKFFACTEMRVSQLEFQCLGITVTGESTTRLEDGRSLVVEASKLKPSNIAKSWIRHLFSSVADPNFAGETILLSLNDDKHAVLQKVADARGKLEQLIRLYHEGQRTPLPFFPELSELASKEWRKCDASLGEEERFAAAIERATAALLDAISDPEYSYDIKWGEYESLCFGAEYAPDSRFIEVAIAFWNPCLESLKPLTAKELEGERS